MLEEEPARMYQRYAEDALRTAAQYRGSGEVFAMKGVGWALLALNETVKKLVPRDAEEEK